MICIYVKTQVQYTHLPNEIDLSRRKPLMGILLSIEYFSFPLTYGINIAYFLVTGPSVLLPLQWPCFQAVLPSASYSKLIIFTAFLFDHLTYIAFFSPEFYDYISNRPQYMHWSEYIFLHYIVFLHPIIIFRIYQCYKVAIYLSLKQIESSLCETDAQFRSEVLCRIKELNRANRHLNKTLSLPLFLFLVNMTIDVVVTLVIASFLEDTLIDFAFVVNIALNLVTIAYLNLQIDRSLERISNQNLKTPSTLHRRFEVSKVINFREIVVYKEYFHTRVFELFSMDMYFTLALALFILNQWVLISQTQ